MSDHVSSWSLKELVGTGDEPVCRVCSCADDEDMKRLCLPCKGSETDAFVHNGFLEFIAAIEGLELALDEMMAMTCYECDFAHKFDVKASKTARQSPFRLALALFAMLSFLAAFCTDSFLGWADTEHERRILNLPGRAPVSVSSVFLRLYPLTAADMILEASSTAGHLLGDCTYSTAHNDRWTLEVLELTFDENNTTIYTKTAAKPIAVERQPPTLCHQYWGYADGRSDTRISKLAVSFFRAVLTASWALLIPLPIEPFIFGALLVDRSRAGFFFLADTRLGNLILFARSTHIITSAVVGLTFDFVFPSEAGFRRTPDKMYFYIDTPRLYNELRWISPVDSLFSLPQAFGLLWNLLAVALAFALVHQAIKLYIRRVKAREGRILDYKELCSTAHQA
ncbi:hypothetical protein JCM10207_008659 [Rhodosporidiobolus poonsookiae]